MGKRHHNPDCEGWLYLAGIKDCCSREIVGFHMSSHMDTTLVLKALTKAYETRKPSRGPLIHSDRESQYCSNAYQQQLAAYRMQCSMSRKGNCHDNAPMESFWGMLKNELVYRTHFRSRRQAKAGIIADKPKAINRKGWSPFPYKFVNRRRSMARKIPTALCPRSSFFV